MEALSKKNTNPGCTESNNETCWGNDSVTIIIQYVEKIQFLIYQSQQNVIDNLKTLGLPETLDQVSNIIYKEITPIIKKLRDKLQQKYPINLPTSLIIKLEHNIVVYLALYINMINNNLSYNKYKKCDIVHKTQKEINKINKIKKINELKKRGILKSIGLPLANKLENKVPNEVCVNIELGENLSTGAGKSKKHTTKKITTIKKRKTIKGKKVSKK